MKKILSAFILCVSLTILALAACNKNAQDVAELVETEGNTVVIKGVKTNTSVSLEDVLATLKEQDKLDYEGTISETGLYLTSVNGYIPDKAKNEFWAFYTTLGEYEGFSYSDETWGTFEYKGKRCNSASVGISQMPIIEGELYIITISTY